MYNQNFANVCVCLYHWWSGMCVCVCVCAFSVVLNKVFLIRLGVIHQLVSPDYSTAECVFVLYFILFILFIEFKKVYPDFSLLKPLPSSIAAVYSSNLKGVLSFSHAIASWV